MRRREFLGVVSGAAAAWPLAARAQQTERIRRIGTIMPASSDDSEWQARIGAFLQEMQQSGWLIGRNMRIDTRWTRGNADDARKYAAELVALAPDVILAAGASTVRPLLQATRTVPIVFPVVGDPVAAGFVDSLARPGGNATGFMAFEYTLSAKWVELLNKEIAPHVTRAAVLRDAVVSSGLGQFGVIQAAAPAYRVEVNPINVRDASEIERAVAAFALSPNGGLIATSGGVGRHRHLIIKLAARHKLPAVYWDSSIVAQGGLISYGPDHTDQFRRAAGYVHRILKGEKPADLPVQAPNKYVTAINLKTAKALGLTIPQTLLARADEVIE